jgi:hypothetical protein
MQHVSGRKIVLRVSSTIIFDRELKEVPFNWKRSEEYINFAESRFEAY